MRAGGHYRIVIEGHDRTVGEMDRLHNSIGYLLGRLARGEEVAAEALAVYGIKVTIGKQERGG